MKLEEAIEVDIVLMAAPILKDNPKVIKALSLSIEALKAIDKHRKDGPLGAFFQLPGETQE